MNPCSCHPWAAHAEGCRIPILSWLYRLDPHQDVPPTDPLTPERPSKKRPHAMAGSDRAAFSPASTPQRTASPPKRQRLDDDVFGDDEATPRAQFPMLPPPRPPACSCSSPSKSSGISSPTKNSSPTKKSSGRKSKNSSPVKNLSSFAYTPVTIQAQNFARPGKDIELPEALADMVDVISRYGRGIRVVSSKLRVR